MYFVVAILTLKIPKGLPLLEEESFQNETLLEDRGLA